MRASARFETSVPELRLRVAREAPARDGDHVVYWMIAARRSGWNHGLQRAVEWALHLGKPLLVLEALRVDYPWASDRLHRFVLDGMADNRRAFAATPVLYHPYVEPERGAGEGLLAALAERAALVVTDEFPAFFLPDMVAAAARSLPCRLEAVDSCGLIPLRATPQAFGTAQAFRRWLQQNLRAHLEHASRADPLHGVDLPRPRGLPAALAKRWPRASDELLAGAPEALAALPVDHSVGVVATRGGSAAAGRMLERFVAARLPRYAEQRSHPDDQSSSGLSPYLHFGHLSPQQVFAAVGAAEGWSPAHLAARRDGRRGWLGLSAAAEEFLDQLLTWRELGYAFCQHRADHERYESLPGWARATLEAHATGRAAAYDARTLECARTEDRVWNAAQNELRTTGRMHNYLRMLWGKKILEWSASPRAALELMIHLNNKYALDGRDPNSYSGIFWCLGRYDRPWGPKRPVFGTVRYMSSASTARKLHLEEYLELHAPEEEERARPGLLEPQRPSRRKSAPPRSEAKRSSG